MKKLSKVKLVKAAAREHIGQVPKGKVVGDRRKRKEKYRADYRKRLEE
jgi:hypothetical protein